MLDSGRGGAGKMSSKFEGAVEGWFKNTATFIGAFYLQHPTVEIVGLLQYVCEIRNSRLRFILIHFRLICVACLLPSLLVLLNPRIYDYFDFQAYKIFYIALPLQQVRGASARLRPH